ncbi:MAG: hypothetical protein LC731_06470 [Acidobacteria bacterium]|nr:hypothetical protein [Acidobacteriota bacterium]
MLLLKAVLLRGIFGAAVLLLVVPLSVSAQQSQTRIVELFRGKTASETKVLEIVDVKVEGKSILMGQPFVAGKGWFKTLVIRVRNISGKAVKRVVMSFNIPELDKDGRGNPWEVPYNIQKVGVSSSGTDVWDYVSPGDEVNLTFTQTLLKASLHKSVDSINGEVNRINILPEISLIFKDESYTRGGILVRIKS